MPLNKPLSENATFQRLRVEVRELLYAIRDHLDDHAFINGDPLYLKSRCYPLSRTLRPTVISALLAQAQQTGVIRFRASPVDGRTILHFPGCEQTRKRVMSSEHIATDGQMSLMGPAPPISTNRREAKEGTSAPNNFKKPDTAALSESDPKSPLWALMKDEKAIRDRLREEKESTNPDKRMIETLGTQLRSIREKMKRSTPDKSHESHHSSTNPSQK